MKGESLGGEVFREITREPCLQGNRIIPGLLVWCRICWYLQGNRLLPGLLAWCELDFVERAVGSFGLLREVAAAAAVGGADGAGHLGG